jgi:hypothetical protein
MPSHTPEHEAILNLLTRVVSLEARADRADRVITWGQKDVVDMRWFRSMRKAQTWAFKSVRGCDNASV